MFKLKILKYKHAHQLQSIDPTIDNIHTNVRVSGDRYQCQEIDILDLDIVLFHSISWNENFLREDLCSKGAKGIEWLRQVYIIYPTKCPGF